VVAISGAGFPAELIAFTLPGDSKKPDLLWPPAAQAIAAGVDGALPTRHRAWRERAQALRTLVDRHAFRRMMRLPNA
jgi:hypothetical protein